MRDSIFHAFFFGLFFLLLLQAWKIFSPFISAILAAVTLVIVFYPLHRGLGRWLPKRSRNFRAALSTISATLLIVAPVVLATGFLIGEVVQMGGSLKETVDFFYDWRKSHQLGRVIEGLSDNLGRVARLQSGAVREWLLRSIEAGTTALSLWARGLMQNIAGFVLSILATVFSLFFMFRDGPQLWNRAARLVPMRHDSKRDIVLRVQQTLVEVVRGNLLTCFFQGVAAGIGYLLAGVKGAVLWGVLTGLMGLVPIFGTTVVWVPVALVAIAQGSTAKGIFLLGWGMLVVSAIDNVLRPYFLHRHTRLPAFFLFFAILGGVRAYGVLGLFWGPLVVAMVPVFLEIYRYRYLREREPAEPQMESLYVEPIVDPIPEKAALRAD